MAPHFENAPPDYKIPTVWKKTSIKNKQYMYGFVRGASYSVYLTDMVSVWADQPSPEEVYKNALKLGITDFDEEKCQILIRNLRSALVESEIPFSTAYNSSICTEVKISENLSWPIEASLCDSKMSCDFFRALCCQNFASNSLSLYKGFQLENMVRVRDEYILYLEENYKTVNGTELMDKYRRQHPESAVLLGKYCKEDFDQNTGSQYCDFLEKSTSETTSRLWKEFELTAQHQNEWAKQAQNSRISLDKDKERSASTSPQKRSKRRRSECDEDMKRNLKVKLEPGDDVKLEPGNDVKLEPGNGVKLEPRNEETAPSQSPSPSKKLSPTKRKRLGLVGKR